MTGLKIFTIEPMGKPRMTRADAWKKRPCIQKYWDYKNQLNLQRNGFVMPESGYHVRFDIPMPSSWSKKKKAQMDGKPHQSTPDKDNLEKALLDALETNDAHIWDGRVTKLWGYEGKIVIRW